MPVPARKLSRSKGRRRRSHDHMNPINVGSCEKCKSPSVSHRVCPGCGFYNGRQAIEHSKDTQRVLRKLDAHKHHDHSDESKKASEA